jgi:hypothetical protein
MRLIHSSTTPLIASADADFCASFNDTDLPSPKISAFPARRGELPDEPPFPPADCTSWNEPERDGHATFPVSSRRAECIPTITNSFSFANSEFTFSNNLRLNKIRRHRRSFFVV